MVSTSLCCWGFYLFGAWLLSPFQTFGAEENSYELSVILQDNLVQKNAHQSDTSVLPLDPCLGRFRKALVCNDGPIVCCHLLRRFDNFAPILLICNNACIVEKMLQISCWNCKAWNDFYLPESISVGAIIVSENRTESRTPAATAPATRLFKSAASASPPPPLPFLPPPLSLRLSPLCNQPIVIVIQWAEWQRFWSNSFTGKGDS